MAKQGYYYDLDDGKVYTREEGKGGQFEEFKGKLYFTTGGGGSPAPEISSLPSPVQKVAITQEEAKAIQESKYSPDIQAKRETAATIQKIKEEAARREVDISTPAREKGFINRLRREQKETKTPTRKPGTFKKEDIKKKYYPGVSLGAKEGIYKSIKTGTEFIVSRTPAPAKDVTRQGTIAQNPSFNQKVTLPGITSYKISDINLKGVPSAPRKETIVTATPGLPGDALGYKFDISKGPTKIELLREQSFTEYSKGTPSVKGIAGGIAAGFATDIVVSAKGVKALATKPLETTGQIVQAIPKIPKAAAVAGVRIRQEPAFVTGVILGEAAQFGAIRAGQKGILKVSDVIRTSNLEKIPTKQVIAPEYFKGQKYPGIKKGQSAGSLLKEFKPKLAGEIKPAGYTAAPKPLKGNILQRGSSELPGLYQAPDISPSFLKVTTEERKLFTINPLGESLRPTAFRITPKSFELVPGLKKGQTITQPGKLGKIKTFFENAPKGKSYIPFVKTEKESIIPFGTQVAQTGKRFAFKFEGRTIPIFEYKTTLETGGAAGSIRTAGDISKISSSSRVGRKGVLTPLDLVSVSRGTGKSSSISLPKSSISISSTKTSSSAAPSRSYLSSIPRSLTSRSYAKTSSLRSYPRASESKSSIRVLSSSKGASRGRIYPGRSSSRGLFGSGSITAGAPKTFKLKGSIAKPKKSEGLFGVQLRRYGKFRNIGGGLSLKKALTTGRLAAAGSLGATFRLVPQKKGRQRGSIRTPLGFYQKRGLIFIEKPKYRLSTSGEKLEILGARRRKRKR